MSRNYLDILAQIIRNNWDQPALTDFYLTEDGTAQDTTRGNHYTYGEMYAEICRVAGYLTALGLQKGDHIAICGANSAHWVIAYLAVAKMQGVSVTVMHSLMPDEIVRLINFSDAKALFTDPDLWSELSPIYRLSLGDSPSMQRPYMGDLSAVLSLADWSILNGSPDQPMNNRQSIECEDISFPSSAHDDLAMICFTSGTTSRPKGVLLPYRSINNNICNLLQNYVESNNPHSIIFLQFAHAGELLCDFLQQLCRGKHIYIYQDLLSVHNLFHSLKIVSPYMIFGVPQILSSLVNETKIEELSSIKQIVTAGAKLDIDTETKISKLGIPLTNEYGLTECLILSSCLPQAHSISSVGKVLDNLQVKISPIGEILVKGENVMLGYYKDPEATAAKIDSDGWLHTGDKGHLDDDGYLYVEGRLEQDIIVLPNGENIRPDNIEALINALPEVSESIVLARNGHLVAIVVPDNSSPMLGEVSQRDGGVCIENTPAYLCRKILRDVNPQLPLFSRLYDVEFTDQPLARTAKQTIQRYLYKES